MTDSDLNPQDANLRRLLAIAMDFPAFSDDDIESVFSLTQSSQQMNEEQAQRISGRLNRLFAEDHQESRGEIIPAGKITSNSTLPGPRLIQCQSEQPRRAVSRSAMAALLASMIALATACLITLQPVSHYSAAGDKKRFSNDVLMASGSDQHRSPRTAFKLSAKPRPTEPAVNRLAPGDQIKTNAFERRRAVLPDSSVLYVNSDSNVHVVDSRRLELQRGSVFVEVVPNEISPQPNSNNETTNRITDYPFLVTTADRTITANGTKFAVETNAATTDVVVTQGQVQVSGLTGAVMAGQRIRTRRTKNQTLQKQDYLLTAAPAASAELEWTRDLMEAATGPLIPKSDYCGGALVTVDPNGQSSRLSLRRYLVDVHIEDGFARTTIDQTYFNHTSSRLEGTFHFPLPADASLSRLAMYVNGQLMEGGMAERQHARNTFEEIKRKMLDPALLEWVDGSTFKMRVFPLEARQEKRIILSYSQRLSTSRGRMNYRFPAGHTMESVREWAAHVRVKSGAETEWRSQSHKMIATQDAGDLLLDAKLQNAMLDQDLVLRFGPANRETATVPSAQAENRAADHGDEKKQQLGGIAPGRATSEACLFKADGQQYLMLRVRPELIGEMQRKRHHWVFLFEHAGDRTPLLARAQIEILRVLLQNAEVSDTFAIVQASTRATHYSEQRLSCSPENISAAIEHLEKLHLVGALDLAQALTQCAKSATEKESADVSTVLVHLGSGHTALGERNAAKLVTMIPKEIPYIGIGVGRRWNQSIMKQAASRTGGLSTQINPDEDLNWRAFDVFSKLHSPRLIGVTVRAVSSEENADAERASASEPADSSSQISNLKSQIATDESETSIPESQVPDSESSTLRFLVDTDLIFPGEELAAVCRVRKGQALPKKITIDATLDGRPWSQTVEINDFKADASYLPRYWAKLEIDRLLAENAEQHRQTIIELSKSMYVMSPYTSLLVLENDEMYTQFNVDRGRKDHWALYPCPEQIEVVVENSDGSQLAKNVTTSGDQRPSDIASTVAELQRPVWWLSRKERTGEPQWQMKPYEWSARPFTRNDQPWSSPLLNSYWGFSSENATQWYDASNLTWDVDIDDNDQSDASEIKQDGEEFDPERVQSRSSMRVPAEIQQRFSERQLGTMLLENLRRERGINRMRPDSGSRTLALGAPSIASSLSEFDVRSQWVNTPDLNIEYAVPLTDDFFGGQDAPESTSVFDPDRPLSKIKLQDAISPQAARGTQSSDIVAFQGRGRFRMESPDVELSVRLMQLESEIAGKPVLAGPFGTEVRFGSAPTDIAQALANQSRFPRGRIPGGRQQLQPAVLQGHRWSQETIANPESLVATPHFAVPHLASTINPSMFGDLLLHAPGLNTLPADVSAVIEEDRQRQTTERNLKSQSSNLQSQISTSRTGRIDDAARKLIEKSRARGWESITLPGEDDEPGVTIHFDGSGRHVWERLVSEGLREQVICDGITLWHVYGEIGLASKRSFSRFHHQDFTKIVPWLLPAVDELAQGADVIAVSDRTVAIVPLIEKPDEQKAASSKTQVSNSRFEGSDQGPANSNHNAETPRVKWLLTFDREARLTERRLVDLSTGKTLRKMTFSPSGTVSIFDGSDQESLSVKLNRSITAKPNLSPELEGLVVLPMPVRTPDVIDARAVSRLPEALQDGRIAIQDDDMTEDDALALVLAYMAKGNGARAIEVTRKRFIEKGDLRDGLYVLMSRFPNALVQNIQSDGNSPNTLPSSQQKDSGEKSVADRRDYDLRPSVEGSPLKQFVRQYVNWMRDTPLSQQASGAITEFRIDAPEGSFLQRLARARNVFVRWQSEVAIKDLNQSQVQKEVEATLQFVESCRDRELAWALMQTMRPRLTTSEHLRAFADAAGRFESDDQIGLFVQLERVQTLFSAAQNEEARDLFEKWLTTYIDLGIVPGISPNLYNLFTMDSDGKKRMNELLNRCADKLLQNQQLISTNALATLARFLGNNDVANEIMTRLLRRLDVSKDPAAAMYAIDNLRRLKNARSEQLLDQLLELPSTSQLPAIWRFAYLVAEKSGRKRLAAERLQHAIQLEFATRPTTINIEIVRADYASLLAKYDELITAAITLEVTPPRELAEEIVQATDQWRTLDQDDTVACQTAAKLLGKLNQTELAWDYLTTPLAENSGESAPWIALARSLGADHQTTLASMAWNRAFEFESTNPEILLEHAQMLIAHGNRSTAKSLLQQIERSDWQPRFFATIQKARQLAP